MRFTRVGIEESLIATYTDLMRVCFPAAYKFNIDYLRWLYAENPDGHVMGMDAWDGNQLAAHYVCIPVQVEINGSVVKALLSLNTATHPQYQGRGLFTRLAELTYDMAASEDFDAVYGIANANSTPGFVRKLGFQLVQPLRAVVGFGNLDVDSAVAQHRSQFVRRWSASSLAWRCTNPQNPVFCRKNGPNSQFYAAAMGKLMPVYAELTDNIRCEALSSSIQSGVLSPCRLFIGLVPEPACKYHGYFNIPQRLRPSPLNFIYRSLSQRVGHLEMGCINLSFLDFDAY